MVELVDTRDLKSLGHRLCRFKPGSGYQKTKNGRRLYPVTVFCCQDKEMPMKITFEHRGDVDTIHIGLPGLDKIVIGHTGIPPEKCNGMAKALLAASSLGCCVSTLTEALEARGVHGAACTAEAKVSMGTSGKGQTRVPHVAISAAPELDPKDEAVFARCEQIMRQGCQVTSSLEEGIRVSHALQARYT